MAKETNGRYQDRPTHEELLAALRVIRAECLCHELPDDCTDCPLRAADDPAIENSDCAAATYPFDWKIKTADDSAWRAFYDE